MRQHSVKLEFCLFLEANTIYLYMPLWNKYFDSLVVADYRGSSNIISIILLAEVVRHLMNNFMSILLNGTGLFMT